MWRTFYKFIGRKIRSGSCGNLSAHNVQWTDLMENTVRYGSTCFPVNVVDPGWANKRKKRDEFGNIRPARPRITQRCTYDEGYEKVWVATPELGQHSSFCDYFSGEAGETLLIGLRRCRCPHTYAPLRKDGADGKFVAGGSY